MLSLLLHFYNSLSQKHKLIDILIQKLNIKVSLHKQKHEKKK